MYSIGDAFVTTRSRVACYVYNVTYALLHPAATTQDTHAYIKLGVDSHILPGHVAIIMNRADLARGSYENRLADLLVWSLMAGVQRVTVFDSHDGSLKKNIGALASLVEARKASQSDKVLSIAVVTREDGKQALVDITKRYSKDISSGAIPATTALNGDYVHEHLPPHLGGADSEPEVAIDFSERHLFTGFLPWHVKLTEFIKVDNFQHFYLDKYLGVLKKYGRIEKRCGK
eukprot:gene11466-13364_t